MKRKIYVCPKCGKALNFSDNPEYTFQCFECDEDFYSFEAKEVEQPRVEGVKDYTQLVEASMKIKEITDTAIVESHKQIEIKGLTILEQIAEYINETLRPIFDSGVYKENAFTSHAAMYHGRLRLQFHCHEVGTIGSTKWYDARLMIDGSNYHYESMCECIHFNSDHEYYIRKISDEKLRFIVENWSGLKDSINRMIPYALKEYDKANQRRLEKQKEMSEVIDRFRL